MARAARLSGADPDDEDYEEFEEMLEQAETAQVRMTTPLRPSVFTPNAKRIHCAMRLHVKSMQTCEFALFASIAYFIELEILMGRCRESLSMLKCH